jgi:hypothetical protein
MYLPPFVAGLLALLGESVDRLLIYAEKHLTYLAAMAGGGCSANGDLPQNCYDQYSRRKNK